MTNLLSTELSNLRRPRLLMQAANIGATALKKAGRKYPAGLKGPVARLLSEEAELDEKRREGEADYSPRRHVDLMMALLLAAQTTQQVI